MIKKAFILFSRVVIATFISFCFLALTMGTSRRLHLYNIEIREINLNEDECTECTRGGAVMKPLIYLYPEAEIEVSVKLGHPEKLSHSYPKYENGWIVNTKPNGDLTYNNRSYYGLYWEGKNAPTFNTNEGFVVKGRDTITFLEEKLAILGLNEREANEFIIYWLPRLENNPYNYIVFASMEMQNEYMPLEISPKPNTLIRVLMGFKKLDKPIEIKEQVLAPTPIRTGFTAVEWGGTEITTDIVH